MGIYNQNSLVDYLQDGPDSGVIAHVQDDDDTPDANSDYQSSKCYLHCAGSLSDTVLPLATPCYP